MNEILKPQSRDEVPERLESPQRESHDDRNLSEYKRTICRSAEKIKSANKADLDIIE